MKNDITRRDFLGATLLASGAALLNGLTPAELLAASDEFSGYGGVGEYSRSNGNTFEVMTAGHKIRDGGYEAQLRDAIDTGEVYDCVIVGGGISGLAAALFFQRLAGKDKSVLVLENHPIFGGEAKQNVFDVDGKQLVAHQGSAIYLVPYPHSFIARFYDSIGLAAPKLEYQKAGGDVASWTLGRTPYDSPGLEHGQYGFWFGAKFGQKDGLWVLDPLGKHMQGAPVSSEMKRQMQRWFSGTAAEEAKFARPVYEGDDASRALDAITLEQHFVQHFGVTREFVRGFLSPVEGGGSGLGPDALSAFCNYQADLLHPFDESGDAVQMFPGGNTTIARLMTKALIPESLHVPLSPEGVTRGSVRFDVLDVPEAKARLRLSATVFSVKHDGEPARARTVSVAYAREGKVFRVKGRSVVMAGGSWTTKHVVRDLPELQKNAYAQFYRSPCMMANVVVRNWRFLYKMGISGCRWFEGVGNYMDVCRQAMIGENDDTVTPDSPVVLAVKVIYAYPGLSTEDQGHRGRGEMLSVSFREYEQRIREQFTKMFGGGGFDANRDIAGIVLNRWGHAYLNPQPGFFFGKDGKPAPRDVLRGAPFGRIAFANTDLAGAMDHRNSILEAHRAVGQLLDQALES